MSACESLAESEDDQTLSPPRCLAGVPLHVNIGRQSPSSSSSSSYQSHRHSRRSHQDQTRVVVRIRPLHPSEKAAGEKCCIRPLPSLEVSSTDPQRSSCTDKKKHVLSPSMSQVNHSVSRRQKSQSLLMPSSLYNDGICDKKLCKEAAKETRVTSLVSGTENTVRFDFDEVIGPGKTQKECYERAVGDVVRRNIAEGRDTTIIALGHRKSGLSYTVNGGWKVRHKAGQHKPFECNLAESAGLLPRAVHDLFQPCNSTSYDDRMTVSMAFYMIECEGGRERDLLSKFENKSKEIIEGVSYLRVDSPQEVKRLMDRVSDTRASSIREGRNFHLFSSFRAKSCRRKTSDLNKEVCSKLTVVNLMTSSNPQIGRKSCESLREILLRLSGLQALGSQSGGNIIKFSRRLDDALLGVSSCIMIGCVSPIHSAIEYTMDMLHLCAMAKGAKYVKDFSSRLSAYQDHESIRSGATLNVETHASILSSLQKTIQQADQAAKNARAGSVSLDAAADKWRSHRRKLSRASTIAALSQMTTMTASKGEGKQVIIFSQGASSPGRPTREKAESAMSRRTAKTLRYGRRHGPRLLRENEELKSEVVRLKKETKQQSNQIMSLEEELESVNRRLVEERQITSKLEDIRNLLRRKSTLQERRIHVFEQKMSMQIMEQELVGKTIQENGLPFLERSAEARNRYDVAGREFAVGDQETCIQISEKVISRRSWEHTREHTLNESLEEDEIYLLEEDEESTISQESAKQMLNKVRQNNLATSSKNGQNASISGELISKINAIDNLASCECQQSFLSSEHKEKIDFYLPTLSVSCLCGKQQFKLLSIPTDLKRVDSILRTWQTEFLASIGIVEIEDFILTHRNQEKELVRSLHKWRASKGLETMRKRACAAALLVWARTCSMAVRYQNGEAVNWSKTSHQLLKIASMDSGKVFH